MVQIYSNPTFCFFLCALLLCSSLSATQYHCNDKNKHDTSPVQVCGIGLTASKLLPQFKSSFDNVSEACQERRISFLVEGSCMQFKPNSVVCPPDPDVDCFIPSTKDEVCAYQSTQETCIQSPCRETIFNYCSACLLGYLFYTFGPCE